MDAGVTSACGTPPCAPAASTTPLLDADSLTSRLKLAQSCENCWRTNGESDGSCIFCRAKIERGRVGASLHSAAATRSDTLESTALGPQTASQADASSRDDELVSVLLVSLHPRAADSVIAPSEGKQAAPATSAVGSSAASSAGLDVTILFQKILALEEQRLSLDKQRVADIQRIEKQQAADAKKFEEQREEDAKKFEEQRAADAQKIEKQRAADAQKFEEQREDDAKKFDALQAQVTPLVCSAFIIRLVDLLQTLLRRQLNKLFEGEFIISARESVFKHVPSGSDREKSLKGAARELYDFLVVFNEPRNATAHPNETTVEPAPDKSDWSLVGPSERRWLSWSSMINMLRGSMSDGELDREFKRLNQQDEIKRLSGVQMACGALLSALKFIRESTLPIESDSLTPADEAFLRTTFDPSRSA